MSSSTYAPHESGEGAGLAWAVAVLLGLLVGVLGFFALLMWLDAHKARTDADKAASAATSMPGMDMGASATAGTLTSYAGAAPANADELAAAHRPYPAALPAAPPGPT